MTQLLSTRIVHWTMASLLLVGSCAPASSTTQEDDTEDTDNTNEDSDDEPMTRRDASSGARDAGGSREPDARSTRDGRVDERDEGDDEDDDQTPTPMTSTDASKPSGSSDAGMTTATIDDKMSLLPFKEGNTWTYRVTGGTGTQMKVTTVGPMEKVGGTGPNKDKMAFKVTTTKGTDRTVSWQAVVGSSVVRYREIAYSASTGMPELEEHWAPHKLHVHSDAEHTKAGAKWVETYQETKAMMGAAAMTNTSADNWSVDSPKASVTVPSGTYEAVVLVKASPSGNKTYWYVPGVGKVKETGGQTEELVSFKLTP